MQPRGRHLREVLGEPAASSSEVELEAASSDLGIAYELAGESVASKEMLATGR